MDRRRRRVLAALASLPVATLSEAHTPYRQWVVYRKKHLLIGTTRADPEGYRLGKELAAALVTELPESQARVARGRDARRLASLMATGQLQVALLSVPEALAMSAGESPFQAVGPLDLRSLLELNGRLLVALAELPDHHAWLVTGSLLEAGYGQATRDSRPRLPLHPGSLAYLRGDEMPAPPTDREE